MADYLDCASSLAYYVSSPPPAQLPIINRTNVCMVQWLNSEMALSGGVG